MSLFGALANEREKNVSADLFEKQGVSKTSGGVSTQLT